MLLIGNLTHLCHFTKFLETSFCIRITKLLVYQIEYYPYYNFFAFLSLFSTTAVEAGGGNSVNCEIVNMELDTQFYAWVESDHPYKPASVSSYRVLFPSSVQWMSVEFDQQCSTTQPEDVLQIYIRNRVVASQKSLHNASGSSSTQQNQHQNASTTTTSTVINQNEINMQKYTPVLKKFSGSANWPKQNVILPGNEVLFSLETGKFYAQKREFFVKLI